MIKLLHLLSVIDEKMAGILYSFAFKSVSLALWKVKYCFDVELKNEVSNANLNAQQNPKIIQNVIHFCIWSTAFLLRILAAGE